MKVSYCGPAKDYSGYGEAVRHDIAALVAAGIDVTTEIPQYTLEHSDFGPLGAIATEREGKKLGYKVKILHVTPNVYRNHMEDGKYHIGRVFWETDKLPLDFAANVRLMDEVWTGSEYNAEAIRAAGVTVPIHIIPEAIVSEPPTVEPYITQNKHDYCFYSIFEWTNRKNPDALLEAYWREFENEQGVSLTIKTYVDSFRPEKYREITKYIKRIKKKLQLQRYAPLYIYKQLMDRKQIYRFHKTFDCFVSTHRGEGWGIPQMEAMLMGKPIISTNCGGIHEYLKNEKDALLPSYTHVPVKDPTRNQRWYTPDQHWAEVNIKQVRKYMRWAYENRDDAKKMGLSASKTVKANFDLPVVGALMKKRLLEIRKSMEPEI